MTVQGSAKRKDMKNSKPQEKNKLERIEREKKKKEKRKKKKKKQMNYKLQATRMYKYVCCMHIYAYYMYDIHVVTKSEKNKFITCVCVQGNSCSSVPFVDF